jgi:hypothetical protein
VTFGAAFILKFVMLNALADPASGRLGRALQMLLEGVTLGALTQDVQHPAAGYIAFLTIGMFLVSVWMLPGGTGTGQRRFPTERGDAKRARVSSPSTGLAGPHTAERRELPDGPNMTP